MNLIVELKDVWKKFPIKRDRPGFKDFFVNLPQFAGENTNSIFFAIKVVVEDHVRHSG